MKKSLQHPIYKIITIATITILLLMLLLFIYLPRIKFRRTPYLVKQKAQLNTISLALELFQNLLDTYPPSEAVDPVGQPYCGAMKLCEALMGRDLMGFHRRSRFRRDGTDDSGQFLYVPETLEARIGPILNIKNANAYRLKDVYRDVGSFDGNNYVICDVYSKKRNLGQKIGMPILYYKANTSKTAHDVNEPDNPENIYNYKDNHALLSLGVPGKPNKKHPLFTNPKIFYEMTKKWMVTPTNRTNRKDSFILLSAGKDGLYGTPDDIANFNMQ